MTVSGLPGPPSQGQFLLMVWGGGEDIKRVDGGCPAPCESLCTRSGRGLRSWLSSLLLSLGQSSCLHPWV